MLSALILFISNFRKHWSYVVFIQPKFVLKIYTRKLSFCSIRSIKLIECKFRSEHKASKTGTALELRASDAPWESSREEHKPSLMMILQNGRCLTRKMNLIINTSRVSDGIHVIPYTLLAHRMLIVYAGNFIHLQYMPLIPLPARACLTSSTSCFKTQTKFSPPFALKRERKLVAKRLLEEQGTGMNKFNSMCFIK